MNRCPRFSWMLIVGLMATLVVTATTAEATGRRGLFGSGLTACVIPPLEPNEPSSLSGQEDPQDEPKQIQGYYAYAIVVDNGLPKYVVATHKNREDAIRCIVSCYQDAVPVTFPTQSPVVDCVCCPGEAEGVAERKRKSVIVTIADDRRRSFKLQFNFEYVGDEVNAGAALYQFIEFKKLEWAVGRGLKLDVVRVSGVEYFDEKP